MKAKSLMWAVLVVLALSLVGGATINAQGGQATLTVINYIGTPLTFTVDGQQYSVPGTETTPTGGVTNFALAPGRHKYTGAVPGGPGANGEIDLSAGQTYILGARVDQIPEVLSNEGVVLSPSRDELVFFQASLTPGIPSATPTEAPLQPLPPGAGALVLDNYIGDELTLNLNGTIVRVPPNGRRQVDFMPGMVTFSASAGVSGTNGSVEVKAGQYTQVAFTLQIVNATPTPEHTPKPGEIVSTPVVPKMDFTINELGGPPAAQPSAGAAPAATEAATQPVPTATAVATQPAAAVTEAPTDTTGELTVSNYIGQTVIFTINGVGYQMVANSEITLTLPPGDHAFTAALPNATYNGSVVLAAGQKRHLGITSNLGNDKVIVSIQ